MQTLSVHIVTYNNKATISSCLQSIGAQTFRKFSTLIIDNKSSDSTVSMARSQGISVIEQIENVGYATAHNFALSVTSSEFVCTLNPDTVLAPTFFFEMISYLSEHRQVGAAAGMLLRVERLGDPSKKIDGMGLILGRNRRQRLLFEGSQMESVPKTPFPIFGPDGAAGFYRRRMLRDIAIDGEVFDEDFFMHKEDVDVCWRGQLRGWPAVCVPQAIAFHIRAFRPGKRSRVTPFVRRIAMRNRYFLIVKNDSVRDIIRDMFSILIYEMGILAYVLVREPTSLLAYMGVFTALPRMLEKRRVIQGSRRVDEMRMRQWFI